MPSRQYALIIGLETYIDVTITPVAFAEADAHALSAVLQSHGYKASDTTLLLSSVATKATIESRLRRLAGTLSAEDSLLFFFAGHGFAENGSNYITCHDTQMGDLARTSIALQSIFTAMRSSKCRHTIFLLDSCHSGLPVDHSMRSIMSQMDDSELNAFFADSEYAIGFAACQSDQVSYGSSSHKHGIWSYHILEALQGNDLAALERGRFLTSMSLQAYLSDQVPRTVRRTLSGNQVQTPVMFGNLSKEFLIVDLEPIFRDRQAKLQPHLNQLKAALFRGEKTGRVKSLSGFRKVHKVPQDVNQATRSFVERIGKEDVQRLAEEYFQKTKTAFGYKRLEIELGFSDGAATILGKDFDVNIELSIHPDDPSEYLQRIVVTNIRNPEIVRSQAFEDTFLTTFSSFVFEFVTPLKVESIIDSVERLGNDAITVHYPADCSYCEITVEGITAKFIITPGTFEVSHNRPVAPSTLMESFFDAQKLLTGRHDIKALKFGN